MCDATATLTLTEAELTDLRAAVRAQRRAFAADWEGQRFRATRLALLAPRLTDAIDLLQAGNAPCPGTSLPTGPRGRWP